jgi:hypothetical protein
MFPLAIASWYFCKIGMHPISQVIQVYGFRPFLRVMVVATPQTQARLLALVMQALPVSLQSELMVLVEGSG